MWKPRIVGILGCLLFAMTRTLVQADEEGDLHSDTYDDSGIDGKINAVVKPIAEFVSKVVFCYFVVNGVEIPFILVWLFVGCLFCTVYFRFINIRGFAHALDIATGKYYDPNAVGHITHFEALSTAVSGTVGLGNIAGVSIAITLGGPGATFWMIVCGLLGMSVKFAEAALGVKYRIVHNDGTISGGPMQYMIRGLDEQGCWSCCGKFGTFMAYLYAIFFVGGAFGAASLFQSNQTFSQFVVISGGADSWIADKGWAFGILFAFLCSLVTMGGVNGIVRVTSRVVPIMGMLYIISGIVVLLINIKSLPTAVKEIFQGAFNPKGIQGGIIGVALQGIRRAIFSNEAGLGSAAVAHAPVKTSIPVTEGFVALYEPFIDTVCVCTVTALVIIITGYWKESTDSATGVQLTSDAFSSTIPWFPYVLTVAVALFAYSTAITWSYYGVKATTFLFGYGKIQEYTFKIIFLIFIVIGASIDVGPVIDLMDSIMFLMALPNLLALFILAKMVKHDLDIYWANYKGGKLKKRHRANHDISTEDSDSCPIEPPSPKDIEEYSNMQNKIPLS